MNSKDRRYHRALAKENRRLRSLVKGLYWTFGNIVADGTPAPVEVAKRARKKAEKVLKPAELSGKS